MYLHYTALYIRYIKQIVIRWRHKYIKLKYIQTCNFCTTYQITAPENHPFFIHFLTHRLIKNEHAVKIMPTPTTPCQPNKCQKLPAKNVPNEPPMKYVVMKIVLMRLEAAGQSSKIVVWLLNWIHCIPMSMITIPTTMPQYESSAK